MVITLDGSLGHTKDQDGEGVARKRSANYELSRAINHIVECSEGRYGERTHHAQVKLVRPDFEEGTKEVNGKYLEGSVLVSKGKR